MEHENLKGLKVAILVEDGFERVELVDPRRALDQAGAETRIVSPRRSASAVGTSRNGLSLSRSTWRSTVPSRMTLTHCCYQAA